MTALQKTMHSERVNMIYCSITIKRGLCALFLLSPPARVPTEDKGKFPLLSPPSPPPQSVTVEVRRIVDLYREQVRGGKLIFTTG